MCKNQYFLHYSPNSTWLVTNQHVRRVEPMHFRCVEVVEQHGSTRQAQLAQHDECRVVSRRYKPSGIWAYPINFLAI